MPSGSGPGQAEGLGPDQSPRKQGQGGVSGPGLSHTARGVLSFSVLGALEAVDSALEGQSPEALLEALQDPALALRGVRRGFADWYLQQLSSDREQKAQVGWARPRPLQHGVGGPYSKSQTPRSGTGPVGQASLPQGEAGGVAPPTPPPWAAVEVSAQPRGLLCCVSSRFQELGPEELLEKEEVQAGVATANARGDRELASKWSPGEARPGLRWLLWGGASDPCLPLQRGGNRGPVPGWRGLLRPSRGAPCPSCLGDTAHELAAASGQGRHHWVLGSQFPSRRFPPASPVASWGHSLPGEGHAGVPLGSPQRHTRV